METDRRIILQLVAMGRISSTEAERLLMAWNSGRENQWAALTTLIGLAWLGQIYIRAMLPEFLHIAHSLMPWELTSLHRTLALVSQVLGGVL